MENPRSTEPRIKSVKTAPQLSRLLKELPDPVFEKLLEAKPFSVVMSDIGTGNPPGANVLRLTAQQTFSDLPKDSLALVEREAIRITRLEGPRPDAFHLRLAAGIDYDCGQELEDLPGPLARAADSFCLRHSLFRNVERAMQLRSFRENRRINDGYNLQAPVDLDLGTIDCAALASQIGTRLDLSGGCTVEAVEIPQTDRTNREIMLAVVSGGALASQKTFEADRRIDMIQYRPATELILAYRPDHGTIEVCGRDWSDRKAVAQLFATKVLQEELSERPLTQRNFDLRPFAKNLSPEIPASLADRILELHVIGLRYALGDYDRKVWITALAGVPIGPIAADVLAGLGTRHGRPFLCDVELFLRVKPEGNRSQTLRFEISNQNRSTLQAETDPDKRKIGFDLLLALGVMSTVNELRQEEVPQLLPSLLDLLAHERDTISWNELREVRADARRLTSKGFLREKTIAAAVLIEDDTLGPVETRTTPDPTHNTAALELPNDNVVRNEDLDPLLSWTINRDYVRETVLERFRPMAPDRFPTDLGHGLRSLGTARIAGDDRPVFLWEGGNDLKTLEKVLRVLHERRKEAPGLVLSPSTRSPTFLGRHVMLPIDAILDAGSGSLDPDRLDRLWMERRAPAMAVEGVELDIDGNIAVLHLPGEEPWTIVGDHRVELVRKLYAAWKRGDKGVKTGELVSHTSSTSPQAVLGPEWKPRIVDRYITNAGYGRWALKTPPA